jgi:para-nitrobenzyl esterase
MDQIAALAWVRKNIHAFGGDPQNVTVFGESAGAQDALILMTSPFAAGLFQKAIIESAGWWMHLSSREQAEADEGKAAGKLGLPSTASSEQLRAVPLESLLQLEPEGPFVDGHLIPVQPEVAFADGKAPRVPFVIGWNSNEASLIEGPEMKPASMLAEFDPKVLEALRTVYGTGSDDAALARDIFRDANFAAPSRWAARQASTRTKVYLYRFSYIRERQVGRMIGAGHGAEIPYVFDSWRQSPTGGRFLGERDKAEVNTLHRCWIAFAKDGRPLCPGAPGWPAYTKEDDELLDFGSAAVVQRGLDTRQLDFVETHILRENDLAGHK